MKTSPLAAASGPFDVMIIGGGVYGLCTAWDAALRGLSVALAEKDDFTHACTAVNYKLVHGGLRYLQHLDFKRMRISILERRRLMAMAPHLISPVEFVIPCSGHGMKGPEVMAAALRMNDLVGFDRNRGLPEANRIPRGHLISADECRARIPGLPQGGLTGGAVYYDAQMYSAERLALAMGKAAAGAGAVLANYTRVTGFVRDGDRLTAVKCEDRRNGERFEVETGFVINMTGPWSEITREFARNDHPEPYVVRSKGVQIFTRKLADTGFCVQTRQKDTTALISRGGRSLFVQPWRGASFIGQTDKIFRGDPDDFRITREDVVEFLDEFNAAYPAAQLELKDVTHVLGGMIPVSRDDPNAEATNVTHKYEIHDHADSDGAVNMISVNGVKYTIARYLAERTLDLLKKKTGKTLAPCRTGDSPLPGGDLRDVDTAIRDLRTRHELPEPVAAHLIHMYGTESEQVLALTKDDPGLKQTVDGSDEVLRAEIVYSIRAEWAEHLSDVVLRRTDLGSLGHPGTECLADTARLMAAELGWEDTRVRREITELDVHFAWPSA